IRAASSFWPDTGADAKDHVTGRKIETELEAALERLKYVRDRSLRLRMAFRFGQVSQIGTNNSVHGAFRSALGLDQLESQLAQDVAEVNGYLRSVIAERIEGRFQRINVFGRAAFYALVAFLIVNKAGERIAQQFSFDPEYAFWAAVIAALLT